MAVLVAMFVWAHFHMAQFVAAGVSGRYEEHPQAAPCMQKVCVEVQTLANLVLNSYLGVSIGCAH